MPKVVAELDWFGLHTGPSKKGGLELYGSDSISPGLNAGSTGLRPCRAQLQDFLHHDLTNVTKSKVRAGAFFQKEEIKGHPDTSSGSPPFHSTAFEDGSKGKERNVFDPLPPAALLAKRVVLGVGAVGSYLASLRLKTRIAERARIRVGDKAPGNARIFEFGEEPPVPSAGRRRNHVPAVTEDANGIRRVGNHITRYDALMMTEPFYNMKRTVLDDEVLWLMQCQLLNAAFTVAFLTVESTHFLKPVLFTVMKDLLESDHAIQRLSTFAKIMGTFNAFFLGNITGQSLSRFSALWSTGFQKIGQAVAKVSALLEHDLPETWIEHQTTGQVVKHRQEVINDISRWSRASCCLLFHILGRGKSVPEALQVAQVADLLTAEEVQLLTSTPTPYTTIWTWHHRLLKKLTKDGVIAADHSGITWDGWSGAYFVTQQQSRQLPYQFMHMLTAIVKSSNTLAMCVAGLQIGRALLMQDEIEAFLDLLTNMLLPLINNSILIFSMNLANPLSDHFTSLSEEQCDADIDNDGEYMRSQMSQPPTSLSNKWELPADLPS